MNTLKVVLGGFAAGLAGAAVWAAIAYFANLEIGWIAVFVGFLVGVGCKWGNNGAESRAAGITAGCLAAISIVIAKAAVVVIFMGPVVEEQVRTEALSELAHQVVYEYERDGRALAFPPGVESGSARRQDQFPTEAWTEAVRRRDALSAAEREEMRIFPPFANPEYLIMQLADEIADERMQEGQALAWPDGRTLETARRSWHYPADVWSAAEARWAGMTPAEQAERKGALIEYGQRRWRKMEWYFFQQGMMASMGILDILFFGLAVAAAYRTAGGRGTGEGGEQGPDNAGADGPE